MKSCKCKHSSKSSKVANGFLLYRCRSCGATFGKSLPAKAKVDANLAYLDSVRLDRNIMWLVGAN